MLPSHLALDRDVSLR